MEKYSRITEREFSENLTNDFADAFASFNWQKLKKVHSKSKEKRTIKSLNDVKELFSAFNIDEITIDSNFVYVRQSNPDFGYSTVADRLDNWVSFGNGKDFGIKKVKKKKNEPLTIEFFSSKDARTFYKSLI